MTTETDQLRAPAAKPAAPFTRRSFLFGGLVLVAVGCGSSEDGAAPGAETADSGSGEGGGVDPAEGGASNRAPVWVAIPDQSWAVGMPVAFDLRDYCSDADGDTMTFTLVGTLPAGLSLVGSVLSGTPTQVTPPMAITVGADDRRA
jgi:hypothetical protein